MPTQSLPGVTAAWHGRYLAGFLASLALALLSLVDIRRGFVLADYVVRTPFYVFSPIHLLMLAAALIGMIVCHRQSKAYEDGVSDSARRVKLVTTIIFALLVLDLFTYRGVPAVRSIAAGRVGTDWLQGFGVTGALKPFAQATSYLLNVWHATMLGILISGLAMTAVPVYLNQYCTRPGFRGSLSGALFALPQPFCSCCSSVMAPSLARGGASTNFLLSFVVGAPMLNITTLVLALALLPVEFALVRIVGGVVVTVLVTYLIARLADRWQASGNAAVAGRTGALGWLEFDRFATPPATTSELIAGWLSASGRLALVLVPAVWLSSVIASAVFMALPPAFGNNLPSVVLAAIGGTLFMISTWSEIPMALPLIQAGFSGPAAALLVVLPAISLPCLVLIGGALRRFHVTAMLAVAVVIVGILSGSLFL
jgi:uncharacterized membrane protein YraQ (UPF0718 family)